MRSFVSFDDLHRVVHAFIFPRLDFCIALYTGITQASLYCLHLVQNAAARIIIRYQFKKTRLYNSNPSLPALASCSSLYWF